VLLRHREKERISHLARVRLTNRLAIVRVVSRGYASFRVRRSLILMRLSAVRGFHFMLNGGRPLVGRERSLRRQWLGRLALGQLSPLTGPSSRGAFRDRATCQNAAGFVAPSRLYSGYMQVPFRTPRGASVSLRSATTPSVVP
jgi:hypothetical protein